MTMTMSQTDPLYQAAKNAAINDAPGTPWGYAVVQHGSVIYGIGRTRVEAERNAREWMDQPLVYGRGYRVEGEMYLMRCTSRLAVCVIEHGGDCGFAEERVGCLSLSDESDDR